MTAITGALCAGRAPLFEATDVHSHREAKAICDTCLALLACRELLHDEPRKYGTPSGTWAGMLLVLGKKVSTDRRRERATPVNSSGVRTPVRGKIEASPRRCANTVNPGALTDQTAKDVTG